jgi:hypothetical protein
LDRSQCHLQIRTWLLRGWESDRCTRCLLILDQINAHGVVVK